MNATIRTELRVVATLALSLLGAAAFAAPITGNTGPGGFEATDTTSDLVRWLKADSISQVDSTAVATWADSSFNGFDGTASGSAQPLFRTGIGGLPNGQPVVRFDGSDDVIAATQVGGLDDKTMIVALSANSGGGLTGRVDAFYGFFARRSTQVFGLSDFINGANQAVGLTASLGTGYSIASGTISGGTTGTLTNRTNTGSVAAASLANTSGGTSAVRFSVLGRSQQAAGIGGAGSDYFLGDVAEFLVYERALSDVERTLVDNYLNAKYAISIVNDHYQGDDGAQNDYDFDVFGIGNDGSSSHTNSGAAGFGIEASGGSLGANEWVLAGHRTPVNGVSLLEGDEYPLAERWDRVWYVDVTEDGSGVSATLAFDFTDGGVAGDFDPVDSFQLLYSSTNAFNWNVLNLVGVSDGSGLVTFQVPASLLIDGYYTLAINAVLVPEPATCGLVALAMLGALPCRRRQGMRR